MIFRENSLETVIAIKTEYNEPNLYEFAGRGSGGGGGGSNVDFI